MHRLICLAAVCTLVLVGCTGEDDPSRNKSSDSGFRDPDFADGSILFVRGTSLALFDRASDDEKQIADLGSADAVASPDGAIVAYVASPDGAREDFIEEPEIRLLEVSSGEVTRVGAGYAPSFSPSGDVLAYLQPVGRRECEGEVCTGDARVMAGAPGEEARQIRGAGSWIVLGWAGERLMVVDQENPTGVQLISPSRDPIRLAVRPAGVWGGSPAGDRLLLVSANAAEFRSFDDGGLTSESTLVALNGTLGQGSWSPNGETVAAALIEGSKGGLPKTRLVTIAAGEPSGGRVESVAGSSGAMGQVLWAEGGRSLAYVKSAPPRGLNLQAVLCESPLDGPCERLFEWKRGVTLLHLY